MSAAEAPDLAVVDTHPIQYRAPYYRALARRLRLRVYLFDRQGMDVKRDAGFGRDIAWDVPLLGGYDCEFLPNASPRHGLDKGFFGLVAGRGLAAAVTSRRPGALLINGWSRMIWWQAAALARRLRIPYLVRGESHRLRPRAPAVEWLKRQSVGRLVRGAAACLAIGTHNARLYEHYGVPADRVHLAPYCIDNAFFADRAAQVDPQEQKRQWGIPQGRTVALFAGKLIDVKSPADPLAAFARLPADVRRRWALVYAGEGRLRRELELRAASVPQLAVRFVGFLNQTRIPAAYAVADALILPSGFEPWGLVVNEAMACGVTAIVSDRVGCAPDLVHEGRTGWTYPAGDASALAGVLGRLGGDPRLLGEAGRRARAHVAGFTVERAAAATADVALQIGRK